METRTLNDRYRQIAEELIDQEPELVFIKRSKARIAYLSSDAPKKSADFATLGECEKVQSKNQWAMAYDYTITVFEKNTQHMDQDQLRVLIFHELLHIDILYDKETGGETYGLRKHDLQDFKTIVDRFGVDWAGDKGAVA